MLQQTTNEVVMIKPVGFHFNAETAVNNVYQSNDNANPDEIQKKAIEEFNGLVEKLEAKGVKVNVLEDTPEPATPDSIFPNNWFSTHEGGIMCIYPMFAENRQAEIEKFRPVVEDIVNKKQKDEELFTIYDYSRNREREQMLEGTGVLVIDRRNKVAYCALSPRANIEMLEKWGKDTGHEVVAFEAFQGEDIIYHTNILMGIGEKNALVALETIEESKREVVREKLEKGGYNVVELRADQLTAGLGNTLELKGADGKNFIVMSTQAYEILTPEQKEAIEKETEIVHSDIRTIEYYGGGSARCMIAEIFA